MITRVLAADLRDAATRSPAVAITGPRQSGKTTLCRGVFPDHAYVSLEPLDNRDFATQDPRGFLRQYPGPAVLDEAQRVPQLFSYLQEVIDEDPAPGRYILTGSQHFGLSEAISQSLAGRIALLHLLPLSLDELVRFGPPPEDVWKVVWAGAYPRIHHRELPADEWLADYLATYVQRDVRQVLQVADLDAFTTFLRLAAGRTAQELNLSSLGSDAGVTHNTARSWISVLEASFLIFKLPPWIRNPRKRVVKAPKLHFVDSGLVCSLLGIRTPGQLATHPLRGAIFESWVASEILKARLHRRRPADLFHLRETRGTELDLMVEATEQIIGVEVKSGATIQPQFLQGLRALPEITRRSGDGREPVARLIYAGDSGQERTLIQVLPWTDIQAVEWS
ncbi:MAG: ATP-binding protein [Gemmatimonadota bacterium]